MSSGFGPFKFALIYILLLFSSISIGIMISLLPVVARAAHISDVLVIGAQAITAGSWILVAGAWSRVAQRRGRKFVIMLGGLGLSLGCSATGGAIWAAVTGVVAPFVALVLLIAARATNGIIGLAAVPAAQAFVIERTSVHRRTIVLSTLASAQALGTIAGPAAAPFMTGIPVLGLAGPLIIVATLCTFLVPVLAMALPNDRGDATTALNATISVPVVENVWRMKAVRGYLIYSTMVSIAAAGLIQSIGFLILDTIHGTPRDAQLAIGHVIAAGAVATLVVQLILIPMLKFTPRTMMLLAPVLSILGLSVLCLIPSFRFILMAMVVANIGFAFGRPSVAAAASLVLPVDRQTELAAAILSTATAGVVIGPVLAVALYSVWKPLTFLALALAQAVAFGVAVRGSKRRPERRRDLEPGPG